MFGVPVTLLVGPWLLAAPFILQSGTIAEAAPIIPSTYVNTATVSLGSSAGSADVGCNPGDVATGGGIEFTGGVKTLRQSEPNVASGMPTGWHTFYSVGAGGTAKAYVVCMTPVTVGGVSTSTSVVTATRTFTAPSFNAGGVGATCPGGTTATGGGFETAGLRNALNSLPAMTGGTPTGWNAFFSVQPDPFANDTVKAFAICMASVGPAGAVASYVSSAATSLGIAAGGASASCMAGDFATGGGFDFAPGGGKFIQQSEPSPTSGMPTGWFNFYGVGTTGTATAAAVCVHLGPILTADATSGGQPYIGGTWVNKDVIVTFTCVVSSGSTTVTPPTTVSTEGMNQSVTGSCSDAFGATATATFGNINIDKTPPSLSAAATTPNGAYIAGTWTNQPVTVTFSCTDALSGVQSSSGPVTITADGANQAATGTCTDKAGNQATATFSNINVDRTAPTMTVSAATPSGPYTAGTWTNQAVTVTFGCSDSVSGVATVTSPVTITADGANQSVVGTCTDRAGNQATASFGGIYISTVVPSISVSATTKDANGATIAYVAGSWANHDVTVTFSCTTGPAGLLALTPPITITTEAKNPPVSGVCADRAGNSASTTFGPIWVDKTAPVITYTGNQGTYLLSDMINIDCLATDPLPASNQNSGINPASNTCQGLHISAAVLGPTTVPCPSAVASINNLSAQAADFAGNIGSGSTCFTISATFGGMANLTRAYVTSRAVANRLVRYLTAAQRAIARGRVCVAADQLANYRAGVSKQIGKTVTAVKGNRLIRLSHYLDPNTAGCGGDDDDGQNSNGGNRNGDQGNQNGDHHGHHGNKPD